MKALRPWLTGRDDRSDWALVLVRVGAGAVFLASGLVKFLYPNQGLGRFAKLGIPVPEVMAPFVSGVEVIAGLLLILGLATRLAAVPLVIDMLMAIAVSKLPILFGPGPEPVGALPKMGLWAFAYQARLDAAMLLSCAFLVLAGAGAWSIDAWLARRSGVSRSRELGHWSGEPAATAGRGPAHQVPL